MSDTNRTKLRDFIKSLPMSLVTTAMNTVVGNLIMTCTDEDMDAAIAGAKEEIQITNIEKEV